MNEESMRILKMVEEGKISAAEASELLGALGDEQQQDIIPAEEGKKFSLKGRKLRILVTKPGSDKPQVNIKIPLRLVKWAEKFIPQEAKREMDSNGIDIDEILGSLDDITEETLVDVTDEDTGEQVRIYIE